MQDRTRCTWCGLIVVALVTFATNPVSAQETLIGGDTGHGGYGELVMKVGPTLDGVGVYTGGRGAWVMNFDRTHAVHIGLGGYGLSTRRSVPEPGPDESAQYLAFGYGGLELGYVNSPDRLVHLGVSTLIGAGGAAPWEHGYSWPNIPGPNLAFVLEPAVTAEVNLTTFARINLGASYRWVSGLGMEAISDTDLSGINGIASIRLGRF